MLPDIQDMTPITETELQADFEGILTRVEAGECFLLGSAANAVVLIPYNEETTALLARQASTSSSTKIAEAPSP